jgi:alpha-L-arabinofuranosidase
LAARSGDGESTRKRDNMRTYGKSLKRIGQIGVLATLPVLSYGQGATITIQSDAIIHKVSDNMYSVMNSFYSGRRLNPATVNKAKDFRIGVIRYPEGSESMITAGNWHNLVDSVTSNNPSHPWYFTNTNAPDSELISTDEIAQMAKGTGSQLLFVVNCAKYPQAYLDSLPSHKKCFNGTPTLAAEWVAYCNGSITDTRPITGSSKTIGQWAVERQKNNKGDSTPYKVKYWEIGNEVYAHPDGSPYYYASGGRNPDSVLFTSDSLAGSEYADLVINYSSLMKKVDPSIKIIANDHPNSSSWGKGFHDKYVAPDKDPTLKTLDFIGPHPYYGLGLDPGMADRNLLVNRAFSEIRKNVSIKPLHALWDNTKVKIASTENAFDCNAAHEFSEGWHNQYSFTSALYNTTQYADNFIADTSMEMASFLGLYTGTPAPLFGYPFEQPFKYLSKLMRGNLISTTLAYPYEPDCNAIDCIYEWIWTPDEYFAKLSVQAVKTPNGDSIRIVVINKNANNPVTASINFQGAQQTNLFYPNSDVHVTEIYGQDGSALNAKVAVLEKDVEFESKNRVFPYTFPPHSITFFEFTNRNNIQIRARAIKDIANANPAYYPNMIVKINGNEVKRFTLSNFDYQTFIVDNPNDKILDLSIEHDNDAGHYSPNIDWVMVGGKKLETNSPYVTYDWGSGPNADWTAEAMWWNGKLNFKNAYRVAFLNWAYQRYAHRTDNLSSWPGYWSGSNSEADMEEIFKYSSEGADIYLRDLYSKYCWRAPDAQGLSSWKTALVGRATTRTSADQAFKNSDEAKQKRDQFISDNYWTGYSCPPSDKSNGFWGFWLAEGMARDSVSNRIKNVDPEIYIDYSGSGLKYSGSSSSSSTVDIKGTFEPFNSILSAKAVYIDPNPTIKETPAFAISKSGNSYTATFHLPPGQHGHYSIIVSADLANRTTASDQIYSFTY